MISCLRRDLSDLDKDIPETLKLKLSQQKLPRDLHTKSSESPTPGNHRHYPDRSLN